MNCIRPIRIRFGDYWFESN